MKTFVRLALALVFAITATPLAAPRQAAPAAPTRNGVALERELPKPNYELASRWTSAKVGKLVFSTSITPHWLEFSDRFWYKLRDAGRYEVVDRRPGQEVEDPDVRPREAGRAADAHAAHAVRRAAPADHHGQVHQERHGDPVQRVAASRVQSRGRDRPGARRDDADRRGATAAGRARWTRRRPRRRTGTAGRPRRRGWSRRRREHQAVVARVRPDDRCADPRREIRT